MDTNSSLKILVDTADIAEWQRLLPYGPFFGVTTNPKLLHRAGEPCTVANLRRLAGIAFDLGAQEIHLQVWGASAEEMIPLGCELAAIDRRVMVKVPGTRQGCRAARALVAQEVNVTLTALYSAPQALTAVALGAAYAVPYLGRMSDTGMDAVAEVVAMQQIVERFSTRTRVLVASVREIEHVTLLASRGVGVFALFPALADMLLDHPLSIKAAEEFDGFAGGEDPQVHE